VINHDLHVTTICKATSPEQLTEVRKLLRAFLEWHRQRHRAELDLIDQYFDPVLFETELNSLPGEFAPPKGRLLLARVHGRPAGCVALRDLGSGACEMKRMFVYAEYHGKGIGRALTEAIIQAAKEISYTIMRLDTGAGKIEAQSLYRSMGFRTIPPYYDLPDDLRAWLVFMELDLKMKQS
jgi:putative acetyltransferase